ncbi:MAG: hypothetical protein H6Q60_1004 [Oscillospiraceae bacterium]|nr:hypothetical protein [Oscillospiraceae bacterium]
MFAFFIHEIFWYFFLFAGQTVIEVIIMFYINPRIRPQFDSLDTDLKNAIRSMDVRVETLTDLMSCLERIIQQEGGNNA